MRLIDLTGKRFGRLTVLGRSQEPSEKVKWICKCDCGTVKSINGNSLRNGNTRSCGCFKTENAKLLYSGLRQKNKALYGIWWAMRQRCNNKNSKSYHNYGGRGITVCSEWNASFDNFYYWSYDNGYEDGLQIDRINNDGNYSPDNCRWVDRETQANNRRNVKLYKIDGQEKSLPQWCREYNASYYTVRQRVYKLGWDIKDALIVPSQRKVKR